MKLLLVVLSCVALTAAFASPSTIQTHPSDGVEAKPADYQRPDIKHLCLKESKQYSCRYVGCPAVKSCPGGPETNCTDCATHVVGQSDVVCCDKPGYDSDDDTGSGDLLTPSLKVGTCDWDYDIVSCREENCTAAIEMENGAFKLGTAWATCYMNADAENCGHPFCDRMVMSFQGGVYLMAAYSKTPGGLGASGVTTDASGTLIDGTETGCFGIGIAAAVGNRATGGSNKISAIIRGIQSSGVLENFPEPSNKKTGRFVSLESIDYYHHKHVNHTYYYGYALMMTGPVTVTSMHSHVEYSRGMLEYTPYFVTVKVFDGTTKPAAKGTLVRPHQYDIMLISDKTGSGDYYKQEDSSYQPEYKPEYKQEYKPNYEEEYKEDSNYGHEGERYYKDSHDHEAYHHHQEDRFYRV